MRNSSILLTLHYFSPWEQLHELFDELANQIGWADHLKFSFSSMKTETATELSDKNSSSCTAHFFEAAAEHALSLPKSTGNSRSRTANASPQTQAIRALAFASVLMLLENGARCVGFLLPGLLSACGDAPSQCANTSNDFLRRIPVTLLHIKPTSTLIEEMLKCVILSFMQIQILQHLQVVPCEW